MNKTNSKYTYTQFANDVLALLDGTLELTEEVSANMRDKASALVSVQTHKAEYNATHASKRAPKGASENTKRMAEMIAKVLNDTPKTASEISKAVGVELTALQVANAVKYIGNVKASKVVRDTVNSKGLRAQREYTAYTIG